MIKEKYLDKAPNEVVLEEAICPNCNSDKNQEHLFDAQDNLSDLPGLFGVDICKRCNLILTNPRPTEETIGYYYPDHYGPYAPAIEKTNSYVSSLINSLKSFFDTKEHLIPSIPKGELLELGCASGSYLQKMKLKGWGTKGVEFSTIAAQRAKAAGLNVSCEKISTLDFEEGQFDLVVAWMVLEHTHNPILILKKINRWLKPGGVISISVPNSMSWDFSILKGDGYGIHIPCHLYHFTPKTIKAALDECGFENTTIHQQRTLGGIAPSVGIYLKNKLFLKTASKIFNYQSWPSLLKLALFPLAWILAIFGQTGRMTIYAFKPEK